MFSVVENMSTPVISQSTYSTFTGCPLVVTLSIPLPFMNTLVCEELRPDHESCYHPYHPACVCYVPFVNINCNMYYVLINPLMLCA